MAFVVVGTPSGGFTLPGGSQFDHRYPRLANARGCAGLRQWDEREQAGGMLPDEETGERQTEILSRMSPEQRWRAASAMYWTLRRHKAAFLRSQHPDWTEDRVLDEVRRAFLHART